jgi:hypothetical protein
MTAMATADIDMEICTEVDIVASPLSWVAKIDRGMIVPNVVPRPPALNTINTICQYLHYKLGSMLKANANQ